MSSQVPSISKDGDTTATLVTCSSVPPAHSKKGSYIPVEFPAFQFVLIVSVTGNQWEEPVSVLLPHQAAFLNKQTNKIPKPQKQIK